MSLSLCAPSFSSYCRKVLIALCENNLPLAWRLLGPGEDALAALEVHTLDRFFDHCVMTPMQKLVFDALQPADQGDAYGEAFSLADCAAAPALFYADWVHPIGEARPQLMAYRRRLLARPSFARAVDEARPYRHFFPPGAPDRD